MTYNSQIRALEDEGHSRGAAKELLNARWRSENLAGADSALMRAVDLFHRDDLHLHRIAAAIRGGASLEDAKQTT